jgi:hypothetical protein
MAAGDDHDHDHLHPHDRPHVPVSRRQALRAGAVSLGSLLLWGCSNGRAPTSAPVSTTTAGPTSSVAGPGAGLGGFDAFASTVRTFRQGDTWLVESDGMPAHELMVGIRSWQQQVPVPQPYTGANAWRIPAVPRLADTPVSARTGLYRGAIALAVNGVPIFNARNNRGDDAFLAGELDEFGGHAGRADDYHYHLAPLHLQALVGPGRPIAYALDGFPMYGSVEPDGSAVGPLDELNGHVGADGGYHYHGTTTYPYLNGGLRGVVTVAGDQVEPQPTTTPLRPAGEPLRGATITGFESAGSGRYRLDYTLGGATLRVDYVIAGTEVRFTFTDAAGRTRTETYQRR